ncbi:MAG TPA: MFS transporter, partial [Symbiobacteriaceae bacterium]|nr:MFS transporter [Symbiobacteriaceae bacterium]
MRRSLLLLLWCDLAIWAGFFAVMPYLPDRMTQLGHSGTVVGLILAVRLLAQQGTMPVSGVLADRWGYRRSLLYGLGIRAAGFAFLAEARSVPMLALAAVLSGVGGSLIGAAFKGAYAAAPGEENLAAKFLWLAMVDRLGQAVGPMLGQAAGSFGAQGGLAVCLFLGVGLAVWLWMPAYPGAQSRDSMLVSLRAQVGNTRLAWLVAVLCGYWAIQQQMSVLIPLAAAQIGRREQVGPLFSLSAMAGLLLVLLLPRIRMEQLWSRLLLAQGVTAGSMALPVLLPGFAGIVATTVGLAV